MQKDKSYISQFKHILIDEYQDINFAQKSMVDQLLKGGSSYGLLETMIKLFMAGEEAM